VSPGVAPSSGATIDNVFVPGGGRKKLLSIV
jgi:hypothetical protein